MNNKTLLLFEELAAKKKLGSGDGNIIRERQEKAHAISGKLLQIFQKRLRSFVHMWIIARKERTMAIFEATYEREDETMFEKEFEIQDDAFETNADFWKAATAAALAEEKDGIHMFNLEWTLG